MPIKIKDVTNSLDGEVDLPAALFTDDALTHLGNTMEQERSSQTFGMSGC